MSSTARDLDATRSSLFKEVNNPNPDVREHAWAEFEHRYAPIIAGFARCMGLRRPEIDDVIQEVMLAFFKVAATFEYDRSKKFRGYLRTTTTRVVLRRLNRANGRGEVELVEGVHEDKEVERIFDREADGVILQRALAEAREEYSDNIFQAFERYVILGESAEDVANAFGMSVNWVHQAKSRVSKAIRLKIKAMNDEM